MCQKTNENKEFIKAKDYAFKLLSYRQRSTKEIEKRLTKKGFTTEIIKKTIQYLTEIDYLNDEDFAKFWIQTKTQSKPVGLSLLHYQLRQKGVPEEIIEKTFADLSGQYDELEAAKRVASCRRSRYKELPPLVQKRRLFAYLHRRGFSDEAITQAIKKTD